MENTFSTILLDNPFNQINGNELEVLTLNISKVPKYELNIFFNFFLSSSPLKTSYEYKQLVDILGNFQLTSLLLGFLEYRKLCVSQCYMYAGFFKLFYTFEPSPAAIADLNNYIANYENHYSKVDNQLSILIKNFEKTYPELVRAIPRTNYHIAMDNLKSKLEKQVMI